MYIYIYAWETQRDGGETGRSTTELGDAKQEPQFEEAAVTHQEAHNGNTQRETKETVLRISSWGAQQEQGEHTGKITTRKEEMVGKCFEKTFEKVSFFFLNLKYW